MTEAEWLACDDPRRLAYSHIPASARKWRLVVCACARRIWRRLEDERSRRAIEVSEQVADELTPPLTLATIAAAAEKAWNEISRKYEDGAERAAAAAAYYAASHALAANDVSNAMGAVTEVRPKAAAAERRVQVGIIRDIFGSPFRPVAFSSEWRTDTAVSLARQMYESRDFGAMPILADAIQDAGCDAGDILSHCRNTSITHVRGCWVVDLVLGKE